MTWRSSCVSGPGFGGLYGDADFSHIVEVGAPLQVLELELGKIEHKLQLHAVL